jgi:hypothetical protein
VPSGTAPSGGADLTGTVNGISGVSAAGLSFIQPEPNTNYQFNKCEIGSVSCVAPPIVTPPIVTPPIVTPPAETTSSLLNQIVARLQTETTVFVPIDALIALVTPALIIDPQDTDNLLDMPVVSKEDY